MKNFLLLNLSESNSLGKVRQTTSRFQLQAKAKQTPEAEYKLRLKAVADNPIAVEELLVSSTKVISIQNGQGTVQDEDGKNRDTIQIQ